MSFTESTTIEAHLRDILCGRTASSAWELHDASADIPAGQAPRLGKITGLGWHHIPAKNLLRQEQDVFCGGFNSGA